MRILRFFAIILLKIKKIFHSDIQRTTLLISSHTIIDDTIIFVYQYRT